MGLRFAAARERLDVLQGRAARAFAARTGGARREFAAATRVLESISYRAVLARGFALVRGADGALRRRAAALLPGESLTLVFADGEAGVEAGGQKPEKPPRPKKSAADQGSLF
jgi:exodeoxyribonuclease VII large subunit